MKNIHTKLFKLILSISICFGMNSCSEDFLEVTPKGVLIAEATIDYDQLLNGRLIYGNGAVSRNIVIRSFESCGLEPFFSNDYAEADPARNNFTWEPNVLGPGDGGVNNLMTTYIKRVYIYNKVINEVLFSSGGTESEKMQIWAEARAGRASVYFEFINSYAKPYNVATAASDLGFPIVTEADVTATGFVRASIQEVYDFIIEDLTEALPFLGTTMSQRPRMHKAAAEALLGKTYVYMNRFDEALPLFNSAIASFTADANMAMYDYNVTTLPGGEHAAGFFGPPSVENTITNREIAFSMSAFNISGAFGSAILLSPEVSAKYGTSDFRLNHFFSRKPFPPFPFTPDFVVPGVYRKQGHFIIERGITFPDVYLLRAECKARTNDLAGAVTDLEFLRAHRIADPSEVVVPAGLSQDELIKFVMDERTREFALEGELWFDTRRIWNDPLFQDNKPYTHTLYNADGSVKETFTLTEDRLVFRFSDKALTDNPDLEQNP